MPFHPEQTFSTNPIGTAVVAALQAAGVGADILTNPLALGRTTQDFIEHVQAARELLRAQIPQARGVLGGKLETISNVGGRLAVESGRAATLDDGIVLFHEAITVDKPSLRKVFRRIDTKAGRRPRPRRSKGQRIVALAVQAGDVRRNKNGTFKGLSPAARRALKRERSRSAAARNQIKIRRQATARAKLKGFL